MIATSASATPTDRAAPCRASFVFSDVDVSIVNVIRHSLYADVPVLAANTVTFIQYDGPLEPELIAHRIGQLPLRFRTDRTSADEGDDGLRPRPSSAVFRVDVQTDASVPGLVWVTSNDVVCVTGDAEVVHYRSKAEKAAAFADAGFPLCPLHAGQRFVATFFADVGTGRKATRWSSVHPIIRPRDDGSTFDVVIQTTGAIGPPVALKRALEAVMTRLTAGITSCDELLKASGAR